MKRILFVVFVGLILTAGASMAFAESQAARFPVYLDIRSVDFYESIKIEGAPNDGHRQVEAAPGRAVSAVICADRRSDEFAAEVSQVFLKEFLKGLRHNGVEAISSSGKAPSATVKMAYENQSQTFSVYLSLKEATHLVLAGTTVAVYTISAGGAEAGAPTTVAKSLAKILAKDLAATLAVHLKKNYKIQT